MERHQQEFIQQFAACIRPAGIGGGADAEIISFLKERFCGFAVDFAGGSHDAAFGTFRRISQDLVRSFDIGADCAHGIMHDKFHADSRRQMNDAVRFPDKLFQMRACRDILFNHFKIRIAGYGGQIFRRACGKIVDDGHPVLIRKQGFGQVASDKSCSAGNKKLHSVFPPLQKIIP